MKKIVYALILLLVFIADTSRIAAQGNDWKLIFREEFNGKNNSPVDAAVWNRSERGKSHWRRWISTTSDKVVFVNKGRLICRAIPNRHEPNDTAKMLTGAIDTKGKFSFKYGKIECRMRTNDIRGNFPAFWMMPDEQHPDKRYGEIDIVEMFGNEGKAAQSIHSHRSFVNKKEGIKRDTRVNIDVRKWHVYGIIWDEEKIIWTIDGRETFRYSRSHDPQMEREGQWCFDRPFYIILNQSVGDGSYPQLVPDINTTYETQFDWVRVYQRK